jgi:hypothetical protein
MYYLLTGRAPFEETNLLRLATLIAQERPRALGELRPDAPPGLVAVVMRCLAKRPDDRFSSYAALRRELEAFSSAAPRPARLGRRFAAGLIDWCVLGLLLAPVAAGLDWISMESATSPSVVARHALYLLVGTAYFAFLEGRFGRSVGKALCGLRVLGQDRSPAGLARALARAALFVLALRAPGFFAGPEATAPAHPPISFRLEGTHTAGTFGANVPDHWYAGLVLRSVTMRRRNGFAGLRSERDASGGAVNGRDASRFPRHRRLRAPRPSAASAYQVVEHLSEVCCLATTGDSPKVWIRVLLGHTALSPARRISPPRSVARLAGASRGVLDAYKRREGRWWARVTTLGEVRRGLGDLAAELSAGLTTRRFLRCFDRVWLAQTNTQSFGRHSRVEGRATPHVVGPPAEQPTRVLGAVASSALISVRDRFAPPRRPCPSLAGSANSALSSGLDKCANPRVLDQRPHRYTHRTQWDHLASAALPALV